MKMDAVTKVLIVYDHSPAEKKLAATLKTEPHQLFFASSGEEAIKTAAVVMPDIILLDVLMPDQDGYQVCRSLRADPDLREVPVIIVTVPEDQQAKVKALEAGADDFINKPFDPIELRARVNNIVRMNRNRRLFHARKKFEQLVELSPDGVLLVEQDGMINLVNAALVERLRLPAREAMVGKPIFRYVQEDQSNALLDCIQSALKNKWQIGQVEIEMRRLDGSTFPVEINAAHFEHDKQTMVQMIVRDMAMRNEAEISLWNDEDSLQRTTMPRHPAGEMASRKEKIVSNISRELRTPLSILTLVSGNLDTLYHELDEEKRLEMVQEIREQARTLDGLIGSVVQIAGLEHDKVESERRQINLMELIYEEVEKLSTLASSKQIEVDVFGPDRMRIWADHKQIRQVVKNLVQNALKFTPEYGSIAIDGMLSSAQQHAKGWPGIEKLETREWACFRVVDNGHGIAREELPYIFDRFYRSGSHSEIPGTGLGLAIAKDYVQIHGGQISVESQLEVGSNFAVYLPRDLRRRMSDD